MTIFGRSKSLPRNKKKDVINERRAAEYPLCHNPLEHHPSSGTKHHHHHHHYQHNSNTLSNRDASYSAANFSEQPVLNKSHHHHHHSNHNHHQHHHHNHSLPGNQYLVPKNQYPEPYNYQSYISYDNPEYYNILPTSPIITTIIPGTDLPVDESNTGDSYINQENPIEYTHMRDKLIFDECNQPHKSTYQNFIPDSKTIDTYLYRTVTSEGQTFVTLTDAESCFYIPTQKFTTAPLPQNDQFDKEINTYNTYDNNAKYIPVILKDQPINQQPYIRNSMEHLDHLALSDVRSNDYFYDSSKNYTTQNNQCEYIKTEYVPVEIIQNNSSYNNQANVPTVKEREVNYGRVEQSVRQVYHPQTLNSPNFNSSWRLDDSGIGDRSYDSSAILSSNNGSNAVPILQTQPTLDYPVIGSPTNASLKSKLNKSRTEIYYHKPIRATEETYSYPYKPSVGTEKTILNEPILAPVRPAYELTKEEREAMAPTFQEFSNGSTHERSHSTNATKKTSANLSNLFRAKLDMAQFRREEIEVKIIAGNRVIVKGNHGDRYDPNIDSTSVGGKPGEKVFTKREFFTSYTLPQDCETDKLEALHTKKGYLIIQCPRVGEGRRFASPRPEDVNLNSPSHGYNHSSISPDEESLLIYIN